MTLAQTSLGALVLLPVLAAAVSALLPTRGRQILATVTGGAVVVLSAIPAWSVFHGDVVEMNFGGYAPPLGIMLKADGLSVLFLLLASIVGFAVTLFAPLDPSSTGKRLVRASSSGTVRWVAGNPGFWPLWLGCWGGLNAVFLAGDLFNTYVGLEVVGMTAVGMVALGGRDAWRAAVRYLFVAVLGSMLFLIGVGLIVSVTGTLDFTQVSESIAANEDSHGTVVLAVLLMIVGLAMKIALVPMHGWLIPAHAGAPAAVSPLLSALVIKASFFVMLRIVLWVAGPALLPTVAGDDYYADPALQTTFGWAGGTLAVLGTAAILVGSVMALRQTRLKPLVAYSTVAQAGYWFLMFPIILDPDTPNLDQFAVTGHGSDMIVSTAVAGTVALAVGHGFAKSAMFLVAGYLKDVYGTDELDELRGVYRTHPMLVMAMGMSAVGLAGMPISMSFAGKWLLGTAAIASSHYWLLVVIVVATLLSAAYLLRAITPLLVAVDDDDTRLEAPEKVIERIPVAAQFLPFFLGTATILTGFFGAFLGALLDVGAPWT